MNKVKEGSNMYQGLVTHTYNPLAGECPHACKYCSSHKLAKIYPAIKEKYSGAICLANSITENLGSGNHIFVCAQSDLFANAVPHLFIKTILKQCRDYNGNQYFFQSKNPGRILMWKDFLPEKSSICTTIESDLWFPDVMGNIAPHPWTRSNDMKFITGFPKHVTVEPILRFSSPKEFAELIRETGCDYCNVGADSGNNKLDEPNKHEILELITLLEKFTKVKKKSNLDRLLK